MTNLRNKLFENLNEIDAIYHQYLFNVLSSSESNFRPAARTSSSTVGTFGERMVFDVGEYFPMISTKPLAKKSMTVEMLMFMRGDADLKYLVDNKVPIWNGNGFDFYRKGLEEGHPLKSLKKDTPEFNKAQAEFIQRIRDDPKFSEDNDFLGRIYGVQWTDWKTKDGRSINQLGNSLDSLVNNPYSRYHIVTAWNPGEMSEMSLPPCPMLNQFYHRIDEEGIARLDMTMYQRSCDSLLGVPFNIAGEALKMTIVAALTGKKPGRLIHNLGDAHVYCGVAERSDWYSENFTSIKKEIAKASSPADLREIKEYILANAPAEPVGSEGSDHVPFVLEQLTNQENYPMPKVILENKPIDELTFADITYVNYSPNKTPLKVNGHLPRMAV